MKIYFTASLRGKKNYEKYYRAIYDAINSSGNQIIESKLLEIVPSEFYDVLKQKNPDRIAKIINGILSNIKEADINVFECTEQSFTIGYLLQKSIEMNKPTVALFLEEHEPSYFILGVQEEKLIVSSYKDENTVKDVIKKSLQQAANIADKRFNFFISPSLLNFLNQAAKQQDITKSTLIRNLIVEHKKKYNK